MFVSRLFRLVFGFVIVATDSIVWFLVRASQNIGRLDHKTKFSCQYSNNVFNTLGAGFIENIYHKAMLIDLNKLNLIFILSLGRPL